jgi:sialate O-acetylesterase
MKRTLSAACVLILACPLRADIKLPAVLGSHMVLQQNSEARLWGWGRPGEKVLISTSWSTLPAEAITDALGRWRAAVKTPAADHKPHTLSFKGDNEVTIDNILFGEVWVCSGQSNMEWPVIASENAEQELKSADHPEIRLFTVENTVAAEPREDCKGTWAAATPASARNFSAVGYYFGVEIQKSIKVPIGLISSDWGGTPAEAWTSETTLKGMPDWAEALAQVARLRGDPAALKREYEAAAKAWLKHFDESEPGSRAESRWAAPDLDDSAWQSVDQPAAWAGDLAGHDGTVWARRAVDIPTTFAGKELKLELGPIDDNDSTYFNGVLIGQKMDDGRWNTPRVYTVPGELVKTGRAVIAVRMLDTGGAGGMMGKAEALKLSAHDDGSIPLAGPWKLKVGATRSALPTPPRSPAVGPHMPTSLYNGMIAPLTPLTIRGVWYQGESNRDRAFQYRSLFPAMIQDWRARWAIPGSAQFPFYFVQIAPFNYGGDKGEAAELREAQMLTSSLPNTGMAVTMDIGNPADIHPTNKKEVGRRLSLWALAKTYGKDVLHSGPTMKSFTVQGSVVTITFDHAAGLNSGDTPPTHFTIAGEDRVFVPAKVVIKGQTVIVSADAVAAPVAVRFAWGAADEPNLRNGAGLPASSFRTDDWPGLTQKLPGNSSR